MTQSLSQAAASDGEGPLSERWWQHLDPRRHIAAAVGWAVFILMTLGALIAGGVAASTAEREMRADTRARLVQTAGQTADALLAQVEVLLAAMQATAAQWRLDTAQAPTLDERLRALQTEQPALGWIGLQDATGALVAATDAAAPPATLSPELQQALRTPRVILRRARDIDLADSYMVGDMTTDSGAGNKAGATTILVETGFAGKDGKCDAKPKHVAKDLGAAVDWILAQR